MQDGVSSPISLADQLATAGSSEVLGSSIFPVLYDGTADQTLVDALPDTTERVLLVQFGFPEKISKRLGDAADKLIARGIDVQLTAVAEEEGWWASRRADHFESETTRLLTRQLIPIVTDWVGRIG